MLPYSSICVHRLEGAHVKMVSVMSHKVERYIEYHIEHYITVSWDCDVTKGQLNKLIDELLHPYFKVDTSYLVGRISPRIGGAESQRILPQVPEIQPTETNQRTRKKIAGGHRVGFKSAYVDLELA